MLTDRTVEGLNPFRKMTFYPMELRASLLLPPQIPTATISPPCSCSFLINPPRIRLPARCTCPSRFGPFDAILRDALSRTTRDRSRVKGLCEISPVIGTVERLVNDAAFFLRSLLGRGMCDSRCMCTKCQWREVRPDSSESVGTRTGKHLFFFAIKCSTLYRRHISSQQT